ncbi:unnamed protein product [Parnassius mnemosyne]|uniref:THAP-type domain-containing protein n=1 Tax=Parnassius mnemosyne TaxID=213953 RepID=A0AAV1KN02_9NEOP
MVQYCSVYGCYSTTKKNKDLKFHRFPRDARCQFWINACQRPDLREKNIEQIHNMYVCSLHFEDWMYKKQQLHSAAVPISNLPSVPMHSVNTQIEPPKAEILKYLLSRGVQEQIDTNRIDKSVVTSNSDETSQTPKTMTDHIPRKRKLRKQIVSCVKKMKFIEHNKSTDISRQKFLRGCDKFLSPNLSKIVKAQAILKPHCKNNRYSKEFKLFCLNIYYSSPHAYKFLSKTLCLPSKRSLATVAIPVSTKISDYVWKVLSQAIKHLAPFERECTLCMDEMSLKYSLFYDIHRDKVIGLHEIDDIQCSYAAGYAYTIMLKGILGDWKQVIGYALLASSKIDKALEEFIINTVKQLFELGFKIRAIVSNQGFDFLKFSKSMGISKEHTYFEIDGRKIYYIFDVPHLIKCVRNNLMNYDYEFNGKIASWDDIYKCYELDKQKDFRRAPKLTESHISPNNFQKRKLRLATQVLSDSVKTAVVTYAKTGDLNPCNGTVEFIDTMDKLFDVLNSNNLYSTKPYNNPYRANELQRNLLLKAQNLLASLIVRHKYTGKDVTTSIKFINAFSITINSIMQLYDDLKTESGINDFYLLTRRLNNDDLEYFFSVIRQASGNCWEPTCVQFERAFRKSFLYQLFKLYNDLNCVDDFDNIISQYVDFIHNKSLFRASSVVHAHTK